MTEFVDMDAYIEKLKKQNKELKESEQRYRHLFEKSPIMIYVTDRQGVFININQAGVKMLGCVSKKEVIGTKLTDYFFEDELEFEVYEKKINENGVITHFETILRRRNGIVLSVNLNFRLCKHAIFNRFF